MISLPMPWPDVLAFLTPCLTQFTGKILISIDLFSLQVKLYEQVNLLTHKQSFDFWVIMQSILKTSLEPHEKLESL